MRLHKGHALNQQSKYGKQKPNLQKHQNAYTDNLCEMDSEERQKDIDNYNKNFINNYFDNAFKKQFKVYKVGKKLCYLRDERFIPLDSAYYGFVVSPKGGLYAIKMNNQYQVADKSEIQNGQFNHSLFRAGQPVQTAGFFYYKQGEPYIQSAYRDSGHYKPTEEQHVRSCLGLMEVGFMDGSTLIGGREVARGETRTLGSYFAAQSSSHQIGQRDSSGTLISPLTEGLSLTAGSFHQEAPGYREQMSNYAQWIQSSYSSFLARGAKYTGQLASNYLTSNEHSDDENIFKKV